MMIYRLRNRCAFIFIVKIILRELHNINDISCAISMQAKESTIKGMQFFNIANLGC